jgi:hypothetical protein
MRGDGLQLEVRILYPESTYIRLSYPDGPLNYKPLPKDASQLMESMLNTLGLQGLMDKAQYGSFVMLTNFTLLANPDPTSRDWKIWCRKNFPNIRNMIREEKALKASWEALPDVSPLYFINKKLNLTFTMELSCSSQGFILTGVSEKVDTLLEPDRVFNSLKALFKELGLPVKINNNIIMAQWINIVAKPAPLKDIKQEGIMKLEEMGWKVDKGHYVDLVKLEGREEKIFIKPAASESTTLSEGFLSIEAILIVIGLFSVVGIIFAIMRMQRTKE